MKKTILILGALLGAMLWTGCEKMEEDLIGEKTEVAPEQPAGSYKLTIEAYKGVDTKALALDGSTLNAHWVTGEKVAVYLEGYGTYLGMLTATADDTDNTKATLSCTLDNVEGVTSGSFLMLLYPRAVFDYTEQDGSAPNEDGPMATKYDYATATVTVAATDGNIITTSTASFVNQQSIYRFGFKIGGVGDRISVKEFTVSSDHKQLVTNRRFSGIEWTPTYGNLTVTPASATDALLYVSMCNDNTEIGKVDKLSFYVIGGTDNALYVGDLDIPGEKLGNGKFMSAQSVSVSKSDLAKSGTVTEVW